MSESGSPAKTARFGNFVADMHTSELRKHGRKIRIARHPFQILAMLLERPGELLMRDEIRSLLWPADTFVDFEHGVNSAVRKLRDALGDSANKPRYIETLPQRGYRFIAKVEITEGAPQAPVSTSPAPSPAPELVGQMATVSAADAGNFVLLPVDEGTLAEKESYEAANDDLGISLLVAAEKLLLVPYGTRVKILEAQQPLSGCRVRILEGQFIGAIAFAPRKCLADLPSSTEASS
ncbi:MAG: winged helix-turn-helix domain-containing protein [Candidatus Acidiferrales bacterium]